MPTAARHEARGLLVGLFVALAAAPGWSTVSGRARPPVPVVVEAELRDSEDRPVRFKRDIVGSAVTLISFTFIGCRVQCPISDSYVSQVEDGLAAKGRRDIRLVTLTIDPDNRPEDLRRFAEQFAPSSARRFLTGSVGELMPLLDGLGMTFGSVTEHPLFFLVYDGRGRFVVRLDEAEATPDKLIGALLSAAR